MTTDNRLAIVTGASRGIGYELARIASRHHYDPLIAAQNEPWLEDAAIVDQATDDPADVAQTGWDAMIRGDDHVLHGVKNKLQVAFANVAPAGVVASQNRKQNEPRSRS